MKALSLYPHYAALMVTRWPSGRWCKRFETRGWRTNYRGPIAICATATLPKGTARLVCQSPFREALAGLFHADSECERIIECKLPMGVVLGIGWLADCLPVDLARDMIANEPDILYAGAEFDFGDYTPGRWAWLVEDMRVMREPIPVKGKQGLWDWTAPANLEELLA